MIPSFGHDDFVVEEERSLYDGFFQLQLYRFKHRLFAGGWSEVYQREIFERGQSAAVVLFDKTRDTLVLVEQFRIAARDAEGGPWCLELVAGMVDKGREPEQVATEEAREEAGCEIQRLFPIGSYLATPGGSTERVFMFCGLVDSENLGGIFGLDEEHEDIKVHVLDRQTVMQWLNNDKLDNAATIIGLRWLEANIAKL